MAAAKEKAERVIDTLTGPLEERILPRMAEALPGWVTPDLLTFLGIVAALVIAAGYALCSVSYWWIVLVNAGLVLHWYADSLDGTLARVRRIERERYGYFVDHICDAVAIFLVCLGLGVSPFMDLRTALFLAVGYFMMDVYVNIAAYTKREFKLSYGRCGPTEVRIFIFLANIAVVFWNPVVFRRGPDSFRALDLAGIALGTWFIVLFAVYSLKDARVLDREDRARWDE